MVFVLILRHSDFRKIFYLEKIVSFKKYRPGPPLRVSHEVPKNKYRNKQPYRVMG